METVIDEKELFNNNIEFNNISKRLLTSDYDVFNLNLKRLIHYIDDNKLIIDLINSCVNQDDHFNVAEDVNKVVAGYGSNIFNNYVEEEKEISYIYQILKYITSNNISYRKYSISYSSTKQFQEQIDGFNNKIILPFINAINDNFQKKYFEMKYEKDKASNVIINSEQVVIAKNTSNITLVKNNYNELNDIINKIKDHITDVNDREVQEDIMDNVLGIKEEINKGSIKKGRIKAFMNALNVTLTKIKDVTELSTSIIKLIKYASSFIN